MGLVKTDQATVKELTHAPTQNRMAERIAGQVQAGKLQLLTNNHPGLLLSPTKQVIADWKHCWWHDKPITTLIQWEQVVQQQALGQINGAYVLAWATEQGVWLARDAIGEKTLYYTHTEQGYFFASDMALLLAISQCPRRLHPTALLAYLSYAYVPGEQTLIQGVYELLPGHQLLLGATGIQAGDAWQVPAPTPERDEAHFTSHLRQALNHAVQRRLPVQEHLAASLSGGIDSSLVVALLSQQTERQVHTWSISFGNQYRNELAFSSLVADHCHTHHQVVEIPPAVIAAGFDSTMLAMSQPIGDPLTIPNRIIFQRVGFAGHHLFNGEGGDPSFGGPKNIPMLLATLFAPPDSDRALHMSQAQHYLRSHQKCYDDLPMMLPPEWLTTHVEDSLLPYFTDATSQGLVHTLMAMNLRFKGAHHILNKVEQLSAPWGITPLSPLFDQEVVEVAFRTPAEFKLRGATEKYLLKQAVRDLLPAAIVERPKSGMLVPVEYWFQKGGALQKLAQERLLEGLQPWPIFKKNYLEQLLNWQLPGLRPRHGAKIWLLLTLESWLRQYQVKI